MDEKKLIEKRTSSAKAYDGSFLKVYRDDIELPDGRKATREYVKHVGAVAIVAMDEQNNVIIEHQYRYPLFSIMTEIPAGKLDSKSEDPLSAAKRELEEETGTLADYWQEIGEFVPTPAYSDEVIRLFWARGLHQGKQKLDEDEFLNYSMAPLNELIDEIMMGKITDGKTQTALLLVNQLLKENGKER